MNHSAFFIIDALNEYVEPEALEIEDALRHQMAHLDVIWPVVNGCFSDVEYRAQCCQD